MLKKALARIFRFLSASLEGSHNEAAVYFLKRAARAGDPWSQNNLGCCYLAGRGTEINIKQAIELYRQSAASGQVEACLNLGQIYYEDKYVSRNDSESFKWFAKAAERGDARGEYRLGLMYYDGIGTGRDIGRALILLDSAKSKGIEVPEDVFSSLANHLAKSP